MDSRLKLKKKQFQKSKKEFDVLVKFLVKVSDRIRIVGSSNQINPRWVLPSNIKFC